MKSLLLGGLVALTFNAAAAAKDPEFPLKDFGRAVEAVMVAEKVDESELAYVGARGSALLLAISKWLEENPGGERDKQLAEQFLKRAHPFFVVAHLFGERTGKSGKNTDAQIAALMETYVREMVRSKQLNNEILSAPISRDLKALERVAPFVNGLAKSLGASKAGPTEEKPAKP